MTSVLHGVDPAGYGAPAAHPLLVLTTALEALLDKATDAHPWSLTPAELQTVLPRLTRIRNRVAEAELRVLAEADRHCVGDDVGATNTPAWWAHRTGQRLPAAQALAAFAKLLDTGHAPVREALAAGRVNLEQARVIVAAVAELPTDLGTVLLTDAEEHLVSLADLDGELRLDPKALRIAGRKILEVIAPEAAEAHEAARLAAEERHAAATATLTLRSDGHGSVVGRFKIPDLHGTILAKHLNAIAAPKHQRAVSGPAGEAQDTGTRVARPLRWGHAFCEYLETRDTSTDGSPKAGGLAATVVVTMTLENLLGGLAGSEKPAVLDTGELLSAAQARRLACEAGIIPAVLGSRSQPLDVGRKNRYFTEPQRIALILRDRGCAIAGCDHPAGMTHAHHLKQWARGGTTALDNAILLCPRHHTLAHDNRYQLKTSKHGKAVLTRRT